jgi:Tfp pilus assembly protein PilW
VRRSFALLALVISVLVASTSLVSADASDREAARILDSVPLPPTAQPSTIGDRARTYTTSDTPDATLAFLRDQLRAAGWTEKSVAKAPANNNGSDDGLTAGNGGSNRASDNGSTNGGAETPGDRTTGKNTGSTSASSNEQLTGPIRARWTMGGATLKVKIDDVAVGDAQQVQGEDNRQTTIVLRARPA